MIEFEFDPAKSAANSKKHGIDFKAAQEIWTDPKAYEQGPFLRGEERWLLTAKASGKIWTAVFTCRGEAIRIISVRRARQSERQEYERLKREIRDDDEP